MKIKVSSMLTTVICVAVLSVTAYHSGYAAADSGIQYNSQGKIVFDNGTENTADDVVFDASDFSVIDSMITKGKTAIRNELNKYGSIEINEDIPSFDTLAASVSSLSDGTDAAAENILTGKKALVEKSIITGTMTDHSGDYISADNTTESKDGTTVEVTIPGGYYDEKSKVTIPIDVIENLPTINSKLTYDIIIEAINNKRSGLSESAGKEEIAAYITANWPGGSSSGKIKYQYHYHSNGCFYICGGEQTIKSNDDNYSYTIRCTKCGATRTTNNGTHPGLCSKQFNSCGKNEGQIIGATITY